MLYLLDFFRSQIIVKVLLKDTNLYLQSSIYENEKISENININYLKYIYLYVYT